MLKPRLDLFARVNQRDKQMICTSDDGKVEGTHAEVERYERDQEKAPYIALFEEHFSDCKEKSLVTQVNTIHRFLDLMSEKGYLLGATE